MNSLKAKVPGSALDLGDSIQDSLLPRDPARLYEEETQDALRRKEQQLDSKSHRKKLLGWLSYAFARLVSIPSPGFSLFARLGD